MKEINFVIVKHDPGVSFWYTHPTHEVLDEAGFNSSMSWADKMVRVEFLRLAPPFDKDTFRRLEDYMRETYAQRHSTWWMQRKEAVESRVERIRIFWEKSEFS